MEEVKRNAMPTEEPASDREKASELLLEILRYDRQRDESRKWQSISGAEWEEIVRQAADHHAAGLLYRRLKGTGPEAGVPAEIMEGLRRRYLQSASRNMRMYAILRKLLRKLKENRIDVIVLKGGFLAEAVYGDTALRAMADLDLLVRQSDVVRVHELILGMGLTEDEERNREWSHKTSHFGYVMRDPFVFIEIHWNIDESPSPFKIDVEGLWQRAQPACIAGVQVKGLSPEDLVLHICIHASFHHLFADHGLQPMYDLAETVWHYQDQIDWEQLATRAQQWRASEPAFVTLQLAERLAGAGVPPRVLSGLEPEDLDRRALELGERRVLASDDGSRLISNWGRLQASRGLGEKISALLRTAFPTLERMRAIYTLPAGSRRVYLYYPLRLKHLFQRQASVVWRFVRADRETQVWIEQEGTRAALLARKKIMMKGGTENDG